MDKGTNATAATVDEYIALQPQEYREVLERLRQTILAAAPGAEEKISYGIPTYKLNGPLIHFAAFKKHCSLIGVSKNMLAKFGMELEGFKTSGSTIHFTPGRPLPAALVKKMVKERIKENAALAKKKAAGK